MASGDRAALASDSCRDGTGTSGVTPAPQEGAAGCAQTTGTKLFPRVLGGITREKPLLSALDLANNESQLGNNKNITAKTKPMGISVSMQTEASWLYENSSKKVVQECLNESSPVIDEKQLPSCSKSSENDVYSAMVEDLGNLGILSDMELNEDFLKFVEETTHPRPRVGPPAILAYKPESSEKDRDYSKIQMLVESSVSALCEFCGKDLKPFPLNYLVSLENPKQFFCCKEIQNLFNTLFGEQKPEVDMISIAPHPPHGSEVERQRSKEKAAQRSRERQMAKYYKSITTAATATANVSEYGKNLRTITYQLSNDPPSGDNWTVAPNMTADQSDLDALTNITCDFSVACEKAIPRQFMERYYKQGGKFLTIFPDATAQLFYPSGNLAVIITHVAEDFLCIVQEDNSLDAKIQALFGSNGKGTCYHPNGNVWINIDTTGGQYSDPAGKRMRTWKWENRVASETHTSFNPIIISLNKNIGVRIFGQDKMIISFLSMGKQAKFSVGVKLKVKEPEVIPKWRRDMQAEEFLLIAIKIKILRLFSRLQGCLSFSSSPHWDKIKLPPYLVSQTQKLIQLCRLSSVTGDMGASIKAVLDD